jgi:hypothetical protein
MQGERRRRPMGGVDGYTDRILPYGLSFVFPAWCETFEKVASENVGLRLVLLYRYGTG